MLPRIVNLADAPRHAFPPPTFRQTDPSPSPSPSPSTAPSPSPTPTPSPTAAAAAAPPTPSPSTNTPSESTVEPSLEPAADPQTTSEPLKDQTPVSADNANSSIDSNLVEFLIALVVILFCALIAYFLFLRWRRRRQARNAQFLPTSVPPGTNSLHPETAPLPHQNIPRTVPPYPHSNPSII